MVSRATWIRRPAASHIKCNFILASRLGHSWELRCDRTVGESRKLRLGRACEFSKTTLRPTRSRRRTECYRNKPSCRQGTNSTQTDWRCEVRVRGATDPFGRQPSAFLRSSNPKAGRGPELLGGIRDRLILLFAAEHQGNQEPQPASA